MTYPGDDSLAAFLQALRQIQAAGQAADLHRILHRMSRRHLKPGDVALRRRFDSLDLTQDAFLHIVSNLDAFRGQTWPEFLSFCASVLEQRFQRNLRHETAGKRHLAREEAVPDVADSHCDPRHEATPSRIMMSEEDDQRVRRLIAELPARDRTVVELRLAGKSYDEIAAELTISVASARQVFSRALRKMKDGWA